MKRRKKLRATVKKVIKPTLPSEREKAEIDIHSADDLYREIRVENDLTDGEGEKARLESGEEIDVILEAETNSKNETE